VKSFGDVLISMWWVHRCRDARRCGSTATTKLGLHQSFAKLDTPVHF